MFDNIILVHKLIDCLEYLTLIEDKNILRNLIKKQIGIDKELIVGYDLIADLPESQTRFMGRKITKLKYEAFDKACVILDLDDDEICIANFSTYSFGSIGKKFIDLHNLLCKQRWFIYHSNDLQKKYYLEVFDLYAVEAYIDLIVNQISLIIEDNSKVYQ